MITAVDTVEGEVNKSEKNSTFCVCEKCDDEAKLSIQEIRDWLATQEQDGERKMVESPTLWHFFGKQAESRQCNEAVETVRHPKSLYQYECHAVLFS